MNELQPSPEGTKIIHVQSVLTEHELTQLKRYTNIQSAKDAIREAVRKCIADGEKKAARKDRAKVA